jgi:alkylhydroperoxidase family enzyme
MRIKGLADDQGPLWLRILFKILRRRTGGVPAPLRVYGRKPKLLRAFLGLVKSVRAPGELPERLKRLAMYWTARQVECAF